MGGKSKIARREIGKWLIMTLVTVDKKSEYGFNKELADRFCRMQNDFRWILANKEKLRQVYANKYIAVENQTVRFTGDTIEEILSKIEDKNEQIDDFLIEFIGKQQANLIL